MHLHIKGKQMCMKKKQENLNYVLKCIICLNYAGKINMRANRIVNHAVEIFFFKLIGVVFFCLLEHLCISAPFFFFLFLLSDFLDSVNEHLFPKRKLASLNRNQVFPCGLCVCIFSLCTHGFSGYSTVLPQTKNMPVNLTDYATLHLGVCKHESPDILRQVQQSNK